MALIFAAITPHNPLLLPALAAEHVQAVSKTRTQLETLAHELYAAQPETLVLLSPGTVEVADAFTIGIGPTFTGNLEKFGDFSLKTERSADVVFAHRLKRRMDDYHIPALLHHRTALEYTETIPLLLLTEHLQSVPVVPVSESTLGVTEHFQFGQVLKEEVLTAQSRVAVIASAELANRAEQKPYEIKEEKEPYDAAILKALRERNGKGLLELLPTIPQEANQFGFPSLVMLFGMLEGMEYRAEILSYEAPVGIGFLVAEITLA